MGRSSLPRGLRLINPGNIRISGDLYLGEVRPSGDKSFKRFVSVAYGYRAIFRVLRTYHDRHGLGTVRGMITRWAPPGENDTSGYVRNVSAWSGIDPDAPLNVGDGDTMCRIVAAMSRMENGVEADMADVRAGWDLFAGGSDHGEDR